MVKFEFNTDFEDNSDEVLAEVQLWAMRVLTMWGSKHKDYAQALVPVGTAESTGIEGYVGGALKGVYQLCGRHGKQDCHSRYSSDVCDLCRAWYRYLCGKRRRTANTVGVA